MREFSANVGLTEDTGVDGGYDWMTGEQGGTRVEQRVVEEVVSPGTILPPRDESRLWPREHFVEETSLGLIGPRREARKYRDASIRVCGTRVC